MKLKRICQIPWLLRHKSFATVEIIDNSVAEPEPEPHQNLHPEPEPEPPKNEAALQH
jgi:hypothetical protein